MIDLHVHSNHSLDGNGDINTILNKCSDLGVNAVSITDHNTVNAYFDLDRSKVNFKGVLIYGMEADAIINNKTVDILCYGFNLENVQNWAGKQYSTIEERQQKIFDSLIEKCKKENITFDDSIPFNPKNEFAHQALYRMLVEVPVSNNILQQYNVQSASDFYRQGTTNTQFPLYIDMGIVWCRLEDLRDIIHSNNGKLFLAHPYHYSDNVQETLDLCKNYIDGIEIYNFEQTQEQTDFLYNYAKDNNLLISMGNDFHDKNNHTIIGVKNIHEDIENEVLNWINEIDNKIEF